MGSKDLEGPLDLDVPGDLEDPELPELLSLPLGLSDLSPLSDLSLLLHLVARWDRLHLEILSVLVDLLGPLGLADLLGLVGLADIYSRYSSIPHFALAARMHSANTSSYHRK
jgi:hypothetical protein